MKQAMGLFCIILNILLVGCSVRNAVRSTHAPPSTQPMLQPPPPVTVPLKTLPPQPVSTNSLWKTGAKTFLRDQRSRQVGDTVLVDVNLKDDQATLKYKTVLNAPQTLMNQKINNLAGFENQLAKILPHAATPAHLINLTKTQDHEADTSAARKENIKLKVSATLVKQLPQGNFLIYGHQQVMINHDRRDIYIAGIVDPKSIAQDNTVSYKDIAEVRLVYGGLGTLNDAQERRALDRWLNAFWPF